MRTYRDKEELKNEIRQSFEKYISEFDTIPEALKDKRVPEVDRTPAENLAYQLGWTTLLLKWEADEKRGMDVKTPSEQFKWNQLGGLYQWFTDTYAHLSLAELRGKLNENIAAIQTMIDSMSEEELFQPHMRRWADDATKNSGVGDLQIYPRQYRRALRNVSDEDQEMEKGSAVNCKEVQQKAQPQMFSAAALLSILKASASRSTILPSKSATPFHF